MTSLWNFNSTKAITKDLIYINTVILGILRIPWILKMESAITSLKAFGTEPNKNVNQGREFGYV